MSVASGYWLYETERLRGRTHEEIAPYFENAGELRQQFVANWNAGARRADDTVERRDEATFQREQRVIRSGGRAW